MKTAFSYIRSRSSKDHIGIVGLPNVGKSTLFNALTGSTRAAMANYPFCTIQPNTGTVVMQDRRLEKLSLISNSQRTIPSSCEFVDIAGIVRGASKGEGLGNKFLQHIREASAIMHVVRCFESEQIVHVDGSVDPVRDLDTITTELLLADVEALEGILAGAARKARGGADKDAVRRLEIAERCAEKVNAGIYAGFVELRDFEVPIFDSFHLLTAKPAVVCATLEPEDVEKGNAATAKLLEASDRLFGPAVPVQTLSPKFEQECAVLVAQGEQTSADELMEMYGLEPKIPALISKALKTLGRHVYYTTGPEESRAWNVAIGSTAAVAAGAIHSDFVKRLIRTEVTRYEDFLNFGGESGAKTAGKMRIEPNDYIVQDGDILHFRLRGGK